MRGTPRLEGRHSRGITPGISAPSKGDTAEAPRLEEDHHRGRADRGFSRVSPFVSFRKITYYVHRICRWNLWTDGSSIEGF